MKGSLRYIIIFVILAALVIAFLAGFLDENPTTRPSRNWEPSYLSTSAKPFGSKLVYERLGDIFDTDSVKVLEEGPFYELAYKRLEKHLIVIVSDVFQPPAFKVEELLRFVEEGNDVFIAAQVHSKELIKELDVVASYFVEFEETDSIDVSTVLSAEKYRFSARHLGYYFSYWDESKVTPLSFADKKQALNLKIHHGKGTFILSAHPLLFTNYYLMRPRDISYIEEIFSEFPSDREVMWDDYYKPGREGESGQNPQTPRSNKSEGLWDYIKKHEALLWAFYLLMIGTAIYVFFGGKRKQRLVPIIKPLSNSTLEFTETIGRLYLFEKNKKSGEEKHKLIAEKKIKVFLEHIRNRYYLKTHQLDDNFRKALESKTESEEGEWNGLLRRIKQVQSQDSLLKESLIQLNEEIEKFYAKNGR